jgi:hypothetical protein
MAEIEFEEDLRAAFDQAASVPDQADFAVAVSRRIEGGARLRLLMLGGFGLAGGVGAAALSWSSLGDFGRALDPAALDPAALAAGDWSQLGVWVGAVALALVGVVLVRPALTEA